jgi:hypothetical protein
MFIMTGGGGGGGGMYGTAAGASSVQGASGGGGGGGGGTVIFSLTEAQLFTAGVANTFQITIGAGAAATPNDTTISSQAGATILSLSGTVIATATGGYGGIRGAITGNNSGNLHGAGGAGGSGSVNASYISAGQYVVVPGGRGNTDNSVYVTTSANTGLAVTAAGGGTYWGPGTAHGQGGAGTQSNTTLIKYNGAAATIYGGGGGGGAILSKSTATLAAKDQPVGGAGANGICYILETF